MFKSSLLTHQSRFYLRPEADYALATPPNPNTCMTISVL
ncbi:hypothetical protein AALP_AAs41566U000500 [Arabis alpina]|uniref:Uncharacterized protein n=1 Tax=Arabis alpina TaxID=50452 RepID=A0A087FWI4_ARAAL|nr:hypothetical protein AALP_AAs41566U000500 [Arabis alpina]